MPDFQLTKQFEEESNKAWKQCLSEYFKPFIVDIVCYDTEMRIQQSHWDKLLVFEGDFEPKRIELKTRTEKYYVYYKKDQKILFEITGNMELNKEGSSVLNSNADWWCYGFNVSGKIVEPMVFNRIELAKYIQENKDNYQTRISETSGLYKTKNILIPKNEVRKFIVPQFWHI